MKPLELPRWEILNRKEGKGNAKGKTEGEIVSPVSPVSLTFATSPCLEDRLRGPLSAVHPPNLRVCDFSSCFQLLRPIGDESVMQESMKEV